MLILYPNGALARGDTIEEGCIIVEEPRVIPIEEVVIDQTQAVMASMNQDGNG